MSELLTTRAPDVIQDTPLPKGIEKILEQIPIDNGNGEKTTALVMITTLMKAFQKIGDIFKMEKWEEVDSEFDPYQETEFERAVASGDQTKAREAYRQYHDSYHRSWIGIWLMWDGPKIVGKMTYCDYSARHFLETMFGCKWVKRSGDRAAATERMYQNDSSVTKLDRSSIEKYHQENPHKVFHVFMEWRKKDASGQTYGHVAVAYFDKNGHLMCYDPYYQITSGKERGEAFPIEMHPKYSSMRYYPLDIGQNPHSSAIAALGITPQQLEKPTV